MEAGGKAVQESGAAEAALAAQLRRIRIIVVVSAALWIVVAAACTVWLSGRIVAGDLADAAEDAGRDAKAIARIVDRMFHELTSIPQVLANNRELRALVTRYNALEGRFAGRPAEQRNVQLRNDDAVARLGRRLTLIRGRLNYDLIYAMDARGIRIVSSDWEEQPQLLGTDLDDREYFKDAMAGRAGHMFAIARTTGKAVFFFSAPIEEEAGPIGAVVVRQTTELVGSQLAGGQHVTLIVDKAGMVVAASHPDFYLQHVGALADRRPDAGALRDIYALEQLRTLDMVRPAHALHEAEWIIRDHPYLVTGAELTASAYRLLILSPIDRLNAVRPLHYAIGAMAALFGVLVALLANRRAENLARRRHNELITAALNDKLKAVNAEKDRYLGIAAHDLRNPLSSMRGLSELMLETPLEPEQQREFLATIHRTSDEMLGLVNDLLDVSVIESGKLDLRRTDQDVAKLIQRRIRHLEPHARGKKIALAVDARDGQRASIDAARFGQVIDNLVSNAIKFSPSGTTVQVSLRAGNGSFAFSVHDQGPGIPEEERKLLFRSFQKLSARPTGGEKSTGLGLAIVKKIVDAHGGTIEVESPPGGGTRFTVTTPSAQAGA